MYRLSQINILLGFNSEFVLNNDVGIQFDFTNNSKYMKVIMEDGSYFTYPIDDLYNVGNHQEIKKDILTHRRKEKINKIINGK